MSVERYVPTVPATQIEYRCWCGYVGTYDQRDAHRASEQHKAAKKRDSST